MPEAGHAIAPIKTERNVGDLSREPKMASSIESSLPVQKQNQSVMKMTSQFVIGSGSENWTDS
jgi:hypothetical protein